MSTQVEILEKAVTSGVDQAITDFPGALAPGDEDLLRSLSADQLQKLLELRKAAEAPSGINAIHGSGLLSM